MDRKLACPVCGALKPPKIGKSLDREGKEGSVFCCEDCLTFFTDSNSRGKSEEIARQVSFHEDWWRDETVESLQALKDEAASMVQFYKNDLGRPDEGQLIVEIGAGRGNLTAALVEAGYSVRSCEPSLNLSQRGREVYGLHDSQLASISADQLITSLVATHTSAHAVFLWHVLEHVTEPLDLLRGIHSILAEGGFLFLQVPLPCDSYTYKEHLFFGSPASLSNMAAKTGYRISFLKHIPASGFLSATFVKDSSRKYDMLQGSLRAAVTEMVDLLNGTHVPSSLEVETHWLKAWNLLPKSALAKAPSRSELFQNRASSRYWWYRLRETQYIPPVFQCLSDDEWSIVNDWFYDSEGKFESSLGMSVSTMSLASGLIGGNGINRIVLCGHGLGLSCLILGFLMRAMGKQRSIFGVDCDVSSSSYTTDRLNRAGLRDYVKIEVEKTANPQSAAKALDWFGGAPQLVLIDSSHQYSPTSAELDFWYEHLAPGGIMLLDDVSVSTPEFDLTDQGGVSNATIEWCQQRNVSCLFLNQLVPSSIDPNDLVYKDRCGLGFIQKGI